MKSKYKIANTIYMIHKNLQYGYKFKLLTLLILIFLQISVSGSNKVYVIHGFASPTLLMKKLERSVRKENYVVENYSYKSIVEDLDIIGKELYQQIKTCGYDTVSFVTHSMGALVVRSMLQYSIKDTIFPVIYRIVMIAPPNAGAEIADLYSSHDIMRKIFDPNLEHMTTDSGSYANKLPIPEDSEIGIIAGSRGKSYGYNLFIKGDNDGYLTPAKTKLGVEKDFIIVKGEHIFLTQKKKVCKLTTGFLRNGYFMVR